MPILFLGATETDSPRRQSCQFKRKASGLKNRPELQPQTTREQPSIVAQVGTSADAESATKLQSNEFSFQMEELWLVYATEK
jgi:hypothetical protein